MENNRDLDYVIYGFTLDLVSTLAALILAQKIRVVFPQYPRPFETAEITLPLIVVTLLIWVTVSQVASVYDLVSKRRTVEELQSVLIATSFSLLFLAGILYFSNREIPRLLIVYFFLLQTLFVTGWRILSRLLFHSLVRSRYPRQRILIVGANERGRQIAEIIMKAKWANVELCGFADDEKPSPLDSFEILSGLDDIKHIVASQAVDEVIIALPHSSQVRANQIIMELELLPVQIRVVPRFLELALYRATVEDYFGIPLINLRALALTRFQLIRKRIFDFSVALTLLILFSPVFIVIALAIKLNSKGPILFIQERAGTYGRPFRMYKFRSMFAGAEQVQNGSIQRDEQGNILHKKQNDPRVTSVGRFLRRTSLDELPQLWNVLKGDMSLVGPRPEMTWMVQNYEPWQYQRFSIPQGITGWWQVNGRSDKAMHLHTEYDLYYIRNYSFLLDLQILWRTLAVVIHRRGAY